MAYINQEDDARFRPVDGLGGPAAPTPMATTAPGVGTSPQAPQAPRNGFVNLQQWLGVNSGDGMAQKYTDQVGAETRQINKRMTAAHDAYAQPVTELQNRAAAEPGHQDTVGIPWANPGDTAANYEYKGPTSLNENSDWRALQSRLGTAASNNANFNQNAAARQVWLGNNGMSTNKYNAAALGQSPSLLKSYQAINNTQQNAKGHEEGFAGQLNTMHQAADPVHDWFNSSWKDGDPNNWLQNYSPEVRAKYGAKLNKL